MLIAFYFNYLKIDAIDDDLPNIPLPKRRKKLKQVKKRDKSENSDTGEAPHKSLSVCRHAVKFVTSIIYPSTKKLSTTLIAC